MISSILLIYGWSLITTFLISTFVIPNIKFKTDGFERLDTELIFIDRYKASLTPLINTMLSLMFIVILSAELYTRWKLKKSSK